MSTKQNSPGAPAPPSRPEAAAQTFAIIDIGSSAIRLQIEEIDGSGRIRQLESLYREVDLGKDTFVKGAIDRLTLEQCVSILQSFKRILQEYQIDLGSHVKAIATNAVREAANRDAFVDRIWSATDINVEVIEEAEVSRYTYMSIQPLLQIETTLRDANLLVIEVSSGSTELLILQKQRLISAMPYRLGSYRLRETLESQGAGESHLLEAMKNQIERSVDQMSRNLTGRERLKMLALGGDIRFAAAQLLPDWDQLTVAKMPVASLANFTQRLLKSSVDELVQRYHLAYSDAETVGPALLTYVTLASALKMKYIYLTATSLREGVVREMAAGGAWTAEIKEQIICSALEIGRKYDFDQHHAEHVAWLSQKLFAALLSEHRLAPRFELLLRIAAILHEIGTFISNRSHHKHSLYLIQNSDLFGLGSRDLLLTALVARYHRRAAPNATHEGYNTLGREDRLAVNKMAAMLRIADSLDRNYNQQIRDIEISIEEEQVVIAVGNVIDLTLESIALREKGALFEQVFGKRLVLRSVPVREVEHE